MNQTQLIKEPTRVKETSSSLIDIIMMSNVSLVENHGVALSHISDHYLIYASLKLKMLKPPPSYKRVRSYKNYKPDSFLADLQRIPWYDISIMDDANVMLDHFNERFLHVLETHAHAAAPLLHMMPKISDHFMQIRRSTRSIVLCSIVRLTNKSWRSIGSTRSIVLILNS